MVDGGWSSKVPILAAFKMGADAVIAVDISSELRDTRKLARGYDIFVRANSITESILKRMQCRMADVLIRPPVGTIHWADSDLGIRWPLKSDPVLNEKDARGGPFKSAQLFD